jgi:glycosidase
MKNPKLQLMIHGEGIANDGGVVTINYPGVTIEKVHKVENKNYLFVDVNIGAAAKPGNVKINVKKSGAPVVLNLPLAERRPGKGKQFAQGVTSSDFIYMLMPDRFSNGDPSNDRIPGMLDQSLNRDSIFLRHGGDLQGIVNHLDYLEKLGVTSVWPTPVLENNSPTRTEHGYKFSNHYKIEPRFGGVEAYKKLSNELHKRGMKLIQDAVYNHVGFEHFTNQDRPMKDWFNNWPTFTKPDYKDQTLFDPYGANVDKKKQVEGWFEPLMPDLNHANPFVANYLIQHAIWSVEEFGVDGWRVDTYIYCDLNFMNRCNKALLDEYPNISIFGEAWVDGTLNEAFFARNNLKVPFKSNLPGVTDFQTLFHGIQPGLKDNNGVNQLYQTLSNDILYENPMNNVIFLDNHDMSRFISQMDEDKEKLKVGLAWLLTCRGIPQMYYGTEVLMKGISNPDGYVRLDFPGGWAGDKKNAFTKEGLKNDEVEILDYTTILANFRKRSSAIKTGKMMQYTPNDGVYVYFRYDKNQTVMCIMNTSDKAKEIDFAKYAERTTGFTSAKSVTNNNAYLTKDKVSIPAKRMWVLELQK